MRQGGKLLRRRQAGHTGHSTPSWPRQPPGINNPAPRVAHTGKQPGPIPVISNNSLTLAEQLRRQDRLLNALITYEPDANRADQLPGKIRNRGLAASQKRAL